MTYCPLSLLIASPVVLYLSVNAHTCGKLEYIPVEGPASTGLIHEYGVGRLEEVHDWAFVTT